MHACNINAAGIPVPLEAVTSAGADGCFRSNFALPPGLHVLGVAQTSAAKRVSNCNFIDSLFFMF
jgi:hypothetical protein